MPTFKITPADLHEANEILTTARTAKGSEKLDITCAQGEAVFTVTGREYIAPVGVERAGSARIPLATLAEMSRCAKTFGREPLLVTLTEGEVKIKTHSIKSEHIKLRKATPRPIDIPDDAPARDLLALEFIFNPKQIKDSELTSRLNDARNTLHSSLDRASGLEEFGIRREQLKLMVEQFLMNHAKTLRSVVKPQ